MKRKPKATKGRSRNCFFCIRYGAFDFQCKRWMGSRYDPVTGDELSHFDRSVSGAGMVLQLCESARENGEIRKRRSRIRTSRKQTRKQSRKDRNQT
ncbi:MULTISPECIES: pre-toxin TG domain-containing protein [Priestia]|nr:hypothetical protein OEA_13945 [Priestia megaterium NCT-2]MBX9998087.1 hypothetical protein [Priestia aryabhattai]MDR4234380.1 hypothetical protein [Priestia megaterium]NER43793.1 hypothetical protein [Priestia megaterium NBRC 15308 = ATCC 14581]QCY25737.1 hypothetical protein EQG57_14540 [Priestia megaterium NBRC 15308 = ATCC 14581]